MRTFLFCLLLTTFARANFSTVVPERSYADPPTGDFISNGVITPLDQEMKNFCIHNADGAIEVQLTPNAEVGLQTRVQRGGFETRKIEFKMGSKKFSYTLPRELYIKRTFQDANAVKKYLKGNFKPIFDGKFYTSPIPDHLPTEKEPWISGKFLKENGRFMDVQIVDKVVQIGTQGHDGQHRFTGLLSQKDIKPFVQQAFVHGHIKGDVFHARQVFLRMLEDPNVQDDSKLGRFLFIGDSISGNYDQALRSALKGKLNIYHPPTNCGPVSKGIQNIVQWLGPYDQPRHCWDVISFNFGHWDSKNTKEKYQSDLGVVISELKKTKAKLIFVTTTPIPRGYPAPTTPSEPDRATGRAQKTMAKFINPWALEVIARHPEIKICDQHALISNEPFYTTWRAKAGSHQKGKANPHGDLHLPGLLAQPIGRQLGRLVLDSLGREKEPLSPHNLSDRDLTRKRPATSGMNPTDFVDLLTNNSRLRKHNRP
ncbi:MAG: SGNH/GDSL hydrolase family protein [Akkermansiaceae bacterium]